MSDDRGPVAVMELDIEGTPYCDAKNVLLLVSRYVLDPEQRALMLMTEWGEDIAVPTVYVPGVVPEPGNVLIKTWSENEGLYEALVKVGAIGPVVRKHPAGFAEIYECPLLKDVQS